MKEVGNLESHRVCNLLSNSNRGADTRRVPEHLNHRCRKYLDGFKGEINLLLQFPGYNKLCAQETQERTRKRIKEDLKESTIAYNEYAEGTLPKLKRTYLRKCQDVEDHKAASAQTHSQSHNAPRPEGTPQSTLEHYNTPLTSTRTNPASQAKPVVTSPQPLRPLDRRPSGSMQSTRNRSPSSGTAFSDLASHGKLHF